MVAVRERCRNCGLHHFTQHCPSFGPLYPGPGKTRADYAELERKIQDILAADIIAEHLDHDEEPVLTSHYRRANVSTPPVI